MEVNQETKNVDHPMEVDDNKKIQEESAMTEANRDAKNIDHPMEVNDDKKTQEKSAKIEANQETKNVDHLMDVDDNKKTLEESDISSAESKVESSLEVKNKQDISSAESKVESSLEVKNKQEMNGIAQNDLKEIIFPAGSIKENDDEPIIRITADEAKEYLLKKIGEYMVSPINPLFALRAKARELTEKGQRQVEQYQNLYKQLQGMQRKQETFLRSINVLPKVPMCHASVSANLPMEIIPNHETLLKRELSITKVATPPTVIKNPSPAPSKQKPAPKPSDVECIDLTNDNETASTSKSASHMMFSMMRHPAPLPPRPPTSSRDTSKPMPLRPRLKISAEDKGIVLQWDMPPQPNGDPIAKFEIFGYQEQKNSIINTLLWKQIGSVDAMTLPMACTLTQFLHNNKYHFAIRAIDIKGRYGNYSDAISIVYRQTNPP